MTNTRITDAEVFERRYPVILREFGLRKGSGGDGQHRGGDGVVRDIQFRIPVTVSILSERRVYHPYGLEGGEDGQCGLNVWVRRSPGADRDGIRYQRVSLGGKNTAQMQEGERIIVMTPGGGGWGPPGNRSNLSLNNDPKLSWRKGSVALRQDTAEASA
jgi:5-oxoprolinase (ATP-hydrolysing)